MNRTQLVILLSLSVAACAASSAADKNMGTTSTNVPELTRTINWDRAVQDAKSLSTDAASSRRDDSLVVPLLLPPDSVTLPDISNSPLPVSAPKILLDGKGYSSVSQIAHLDILIDGTNQTYLSEGKASAPASEDSIGDYQSIEGGGQMSLGRYGALYSVQVLCQDAREMCVGEKIMREIVETLEVRVRAPQE